VLEKSVAVLPFDNQNRDPNIDYLSDGITESFAGATLGKRKSLHVILESKQRPPGRLAIV
jgi:TolB-like protein